ncbi:MAG: UDP-3-O-acyl-N-acetylglucosamine deacetylase, partial [Snowella sp.]
MTTIKAAFIRSGTGLHSGVTTQIRVLPAAVSEGRYFRRVDLPGTPKIPATVAAVRQTTLSTELATVGASVRTVEHLLAALAASGIDDACIEIDGPEVPLLDGSAQEWVEAIAQVGITASGVSQSPNPKWDDPIWICEGDAFVAAL